MGAEMRPIRRGDRGNAVAEIRSILRGLGLLGSDLPSVNGASTGRFTEFDSRIELAVRAFQQSRGLTVDGQVGEETWRALDAARWRLGARTLYQSVAEPLIGDDVRHLQERLLEMGYDVGRADGIYGPRTARAVAIFQREVGLRPDGSCGPQTMNALRRLGRKVTGGAPLALRETVKLYGSGRALVDKTLVIDPGHGGPDLGVVVPDGLLRWTEADLAFDLAMRLEGRLGAAGMRVHLTRGPSSEAELPDRARAQLANDLGADLFISLHLDGHHNPAANGVATYHFGSDSGITSTVGERLAGLVQREIVMRTGLRNCQTHPKTWELLRLTRMPAVRVEVGYLTSPVDRARLIDPLFRERLVEAIVAAVQRMYYPVEDDVPTGSIDVSTLRAAVASA
jgi:N-acetylmuramoyl-L-alanine amidase